MIDNSSFRFIDGFLSKEECEMFYNYIVNNSLDDPKDNFRYVPINAENINEMDPSGKLQETIGFVEKFFLDSYTIYGELEYNRMFGNIMLPGSFLMPHKDEDPNPDGDYDGKKRSFVCSILLNNDYEGGELYFPELGVGGKPEPGGLTLFPGFYTEHEVKEIISGQRVNILIFFYDMLP